MDTVNTFKILPPVGDKMMGLTGIIEVIAG